MLSHINCQLISLKPKWSLHLWRNTPTIQKDDKNECYRLNFQGNISYIIKDGSHLGDQSPLMVSLGSCTPYTLFSLFTLQIAMIYILTYHSNNVSGLSPIGYNTQDNWEYPVWFVLTICLFVRINMNYNLNHRCPWIVSIILH